MAKVFLNGNVIHTKGDLPKAGDKAPHFSLVGQDLGEMSEEHFKGKKVIMNIFPSLDTKTCSIALKQFYKKLEDQEGVALLNISKDLPFAMSRFCSNEKLSDAVTLSGFRSDFGSAYGVEMEDGPLKGLFCRAVVVLDETGKVIFSETVEEITREPDYAKVMAVALER